MEIKNFKKIEKGALKASFTAYIPEWDFNLVMSYFEKDDGSSWFGYPSQEWTNQEGEKKYKWMAFFGEKSKIKFEKSLKEQLKPMLGARQADPTANYNNDDLPF